MSGKKFNNDDNDKVDFGYSTAVAGVIIAAILIAIMFATSGQI